MPAHSCTGFTPFEERKSQFNYEPIHFVKVLHKDVVANLNISPASIGALLKPYVAQELKYNVLNSIKQKAIIAICGDPVKEVNKLNVIKDLVEQQGHFLHLTWQT